MASLQNGGFELGDGGVADGWAFFSQTAGGEMLPLESFEDGWGNTDPSPQLFALMFGGGETRESFERLWGPADGSDPDLPDVVPPATYTENASFQPTLTLVAAGPPLDSFELWVPGPYILDFDDLVSVPSAFEDFESGWDNDMFEDELVDGVTLAGMTFYDGDPQVLEKFDTVRIIDGHELITILNNPPPIGTFFTYINGVPFSTEAELGDTDVLVAQQLASVIDTSTYPYAAAQWLAESAFYVRNQSTTPMLVRVEGPTGDGTDIRITTTLLLTNFWLMPLE